MARKNLERLEKLVISLLVQIQEIKCSQDIVNRGSQREVTGSDRLFFHSENHERMLDLIFESKTGVEID